MRRYLLLLVLYLVFAPPAGAQNLRLTPVTDLAFGEVVPASTISGGTMTINAATGTISSTNAYQIGTPSRGSLIFRGRSGLNIGVTVAVDPLLCDATYLGACVGTPTITATHDFPGQISPNNCQPAPQCEDVINIGGTFSFPAGSEGRWTTTINIIANYQ